MEERGLPEGDGLSQETLEDFLELLQELERTGLLKAMIGILRGREELLEKVTTWLENNRNLVQNATLFLSAVTSLDVEEIEYASSLTQLLNLLKDPEVVKGLSVFLALMKEIGRNFG